MVFPLRRSANTLGLGHTLSYAAMPISSIAPPPCTLLAPSLRSSRNDN